MRQKQNERKSGARQVTLGRKLRGRDQNISRGRLGATRSGVNKNGSAPYEYINCIRPFFICQSRIQTEKEHSNQRRV